MRLRAAGLPLVALAGAARAQAPPVNPSPACFERNPWSCAPVPWVPTYNLSESTAMFTNYPRNEVYNLSDRFFGWVGFDWSTSVGIWARTGQPNRYEAEALAVANCANVKARGLGKRCIVYKNLEVALQCQESQRAAMLEPANDAMFVHWQDGNHVANGTIYNQQMGNCAGCWQDCIVNCSVPNHGNDNCTYVPVVSGSLCPQPNVGTWPGGCSSITNISTAGSDPTDCLGSQYFFNYTHPGAVDNLVDSALTLIQSGGGGNVDGFFTDDFDGFPSEHYWLDKMLNVSYDQMVVLSNASRAAWQTLLDALVPVGGYIYQAVPQESSPVRNTSDSARCVAWWATRCNSDFVNSRPWFLEHMVDDPAHPEIPYSNLSIAAFLVWRPAHAWLFSGGAQIGVGSLRRPGGRGAQARRLQVSDCYGDPSSQRCWDPKWMWDVGEPQGVCYEAAPGVFTRAWTYGNATLNCNTMTAEVPVNPSQHRLS